MTPSYLECVFSRWPEYQLPLTGSPPSVWFLSLCLHLPFNSFKRLCGARCGGTVVCNCKSSLGRWKQEDQEFRVVLGYRESSNPVWYAWVSSSKQNRVSEGRTLGCRCSSGGSLQGRMSVPSSQGIVLTQWADSWKSQRWPEIKFWCRSGVQSLSRLLLTQARLDYTTVERPRAIISELVSVVCRRAT